MIFHISVRPVVWGTKLVTPKLMLKQGFKDLKISHTCIASGTKAEGKWLYEIETDTVESRDEILRGLTFWGVRLETIHTASTLAEKLVKKSVTINKDGKIHITQELDPIGELDGRS